MVKRRLAVVLLNLGGPDNLSAVRPFLRNLFNDPAIINLPWPWRGLLAHLISLIRGSKARKIYRKLGGSSPLLPNTLDQKIHLSCLLQSLLPNQVVEVFIAMRYWHPFSAETVSHVKSFCPDEVILLPLYPQYSLTTTGSSFKEWHRQANKQRLGVLTHEINSYPEEPSFIAAHEDLLIPWIDRAKTYGRPRVLFSAHGLPQKVIDAGDPYEKQINQTAQGILKGILKRQEGPIDSVVCYQSRVGPLKWIGPSTEQELARAGQDKVPVVVVPLAFVSEHSETLVELDMDYRELAKKAGVPFYGRVPALGVHPAYIQALADLVVRAEVGPE